jgi:DNA (cytosine-5)-methyltransferase 1
MARIYHFKKNNMKHLGLFEGIGGFSLAARWAGWETVAWCEWNEFGQRILKHHFPEAEGFGDITKTDFTKYANKIDILTGGFPCQPYSLAGKRLGKDDDRHLWSEMLRAIQEIRPPWVVGENVRGLINWSGGLVFDEIHADLEAEGYEVQAFLLPACGVDAPHKRDRVWFVAYSTSNRRERERAGIEAKKGLQPGPKSAGELAGRLKGLCGKSTFTNTSNIGHELSGRTRSGRTGLKDSNKSIITDSNNERQQERDISGITEGQGQHNSLCDAIPDWQNFPTQPPVCGGNDGLSYRLVDITFPKWRNESIKAYGNAIVPQVAYQIFKAINEFEKKD